MVSALTQAVADTRDTPSTNGSNRREDGPAKDIVENLSVAQYLDKKAGAVIRCPLPGHDDWVPSFKIYSGGFKCYGCGGKGGSVIDLAMQMHGLDKSEAVRHLAPRVGIQLGDASKGTVLDYPTPTADATVTPYTLETVADARKRPPQSYIVDGIIPAGGMLVEVIAPRGVGKSWLTLSLSLACHTGQTKWMGHTLTATNALYVPLEAPYTVEPRATIWGFTHRADVDNFAYVTESRLGLLQDGGARLVATIAEHDAGLVVLDAWRQVLEGASDEDKVIAPKVLDLVQQIAVQTKATIVLLHNTGWTATGRARGLSAFEDAADVILTLSEDNDQVKVETTKNRLGPELPPWYLKLDPTGGGVPTRCDGITVIERTDRIETDTFDAVAQSDAGLTRDGLCKVVTGRRKDIREAASRLVEAGRLVENNDGKWPVLTLPESNRSQPFPTVPGTVQTYPFPRSHPLGGNGYGQDQGNGQPFPGTGTGTDHPDDTPAGRLFVSPEPPAHRDPS